MFHLLFSSGLTLSNTSFIQLYKYLVLFPYNINFVPENVNKIASYLVLAKKISLSPTSVGWGSRRGNQASS